MNKRTYSIIKACKNKDLQYTRESTPLERVKMYMSEECGTPIEHYTDRVMDGIMFEAMCDYIDTCDRPSAFLRSLEHLVCKDKMCRAEQIATVLMLVQVLNEQGHYVNGFCDVV